MTRPQSAAPNLGVDKIANTPETQQHVEVAKPAVDAAVLLQALQLNLKDPKVRRDMRKQVSPSQNNV
jgi:hypothetical protein